MTEKSVSLLVAIVIYHPDVAWLEKTLGSLAVALGEARRGAQITQATIVLVDNAATAAESPHQAALIYELGAYPWIKLTTLAGHGNVGYGAANNKAVSSQTPHDFVLILNPDVALARDAVSAAVGYLQTHAGAVLVSPVAVSENGAPLYLAYRYPTVLTLGLRGFAPTFIKGFFTSTLARYEIRGSGDPPFDGALEKLTLVSGCFMLMRGNAFRDAAGFDEHFFLYFEDFDLALRLSRLGNMVRLPACRITHAGGGASRKGLRHIRLFCRSALQFFNKHGWRWC